MLKIYNFILILVFIPTIFYSQNVDIIPQLKKIEAGQIDEVKEELARLKLRNSGKPNVIFLEAVMTEDGETAKKLYELVYTNFPNSQFADASLFRNYSYYFALGLYKKAEDLRNKLLEDFPNSPYLKSTSVNLPTSDEMLIIDSSPIKIKQSDEVRYTIQAGAFGQFDNAYNLKKKFDEDNLEAKISPKHVNNVQLHIVTVGNFTLRSNAETFLERINKEYSIVGRIITID
jgi:tetratricopeptide (TPR) repeat protein